MTGVLVPLAAFWGLTRAWGYEVNTAVFYGLVFAATSISITVEVLSEYNRMKTKTGAIIIGAAVVDDILAVILLSVFVGSTGASVNLLSQSLIQIAFFIFLFICMKFLIPLLFRWSKQLDFLEKETLLALLICFSLSLLADAVGISAIIGEFFAGLAIGLTSYLKKVETHIATLSYTLFIPIFFTSIALPFHLDGMLSHTATILLLTAMAVLTKLLPGYLVGRGYQFGKLDSLTIGGGMVSRGEMTLIIVQIGLTEKIISATTYSELVIVVILSTSIAPFILKYSFRES
ncbi:Kef-type K+ transport system membrane component KefB [Streptococcus gallinaceus]|nr:Kef-type K+ transport system membrane component KefB [Streptococcus gallinaceus]MCP1769151.1 Kef-type K+ transport system membrane component KefB [Streptococcus gallinaceus]